MPLFIGFLKLWLPESLPSKNQFSKTSFKQTRTLHFSDVLTTQLPVFYRRGCVASFNNALIIPPSPPPSTLSSFHLLMLVCYCAVQNYFLLKRKKKNKTKQYIVMEPFFICINLIFMFNSVTKVLIDLRGLQFQTTGNCCTGCLASYFRPSTESRGVFLLGLYVCAVNLSKGLQACSQAFQGLSSY